MKTDPEKFENDVAAAVRDYFKIPLTQAVDDGITPPILIEDLLRAAYMALDALAQDNRHNIGRALQKLADYTAARFEDLPKR